MLFRWRSMDQRRCTRKYTNTHKHPHPHTGDEITTLLNKPTVSANVLGIFSRTPAAKLTVIQRRDVVASRRRVAHYNMLNESQQRNGNRADNIVLYPQEKDIHDETNDVQIEIEKREGGKNKIHQQQERKKEDSTQGRYALYTHTSGSQGARGGCSVETK